MAKHWQGQDPGQVRAVSQNLSHKCLVPSLLELRKCRTAQK